MAAVPPITDSLSAPLSSPLVLPPSNSSQPALGLSPSSSTSAATATQTTQSSQSTQSTQTTSASDAPGTTATDSTGATTAAPLAGSTNQPLAVVLDALSSAGVDAAINQEILAPSIGQPAGTFSTFIEQLFTALAAQSAAAEQSQQTAAAQQATQATAQTQSSAALNAFTTGTQSGAPNSTLEIDVQTLAQTVNAQNANPTLAAEAASADTATLSPLQQSFDQFIADVGGTQSSANLGGFLQALATNLHTVQSPLGNIVNAQT